MTLGEVTIANMPELINLSLSPPFEIILQALLEEEAFQSDLQLIENLTQDEFRRLSSELNAIAGFVNRSDVVRVVDIAVKDETTRPAVTRIIWKLSSLVRRSPGTADENGEELKRQIHAKFPDTSPGDNLVSRLQEIILAPSAFDRRAKATYLAKCTGKELEAIEFLCDIRPIFNDDRTAIIGAIPYTTVRIELNDVGTVTSHEIRLTESQVDEISKKLERVRSKLTTIREFATQVELTIPQVGG